MDFQPMRPVRAALILSTVAVLLVAGSDAARAQNDLRRIGIVVTVEVNLEPGAASTVATEMGEALRQKLPVDIIAGDETARRLPPDGLPDECVADAACRNDLGRRLDADELLLLVVVKIGDTLQVDTTWADVASGRVASRPRIELPGLDGAREVFAGEAERLLPHLVDRGGKDGDGETKIVVVTPETPAKKGGRHLTTGSWIAGGVGAAALIGGTVFALSARTKHDGLVADGCRSMPCDEDRIDSLSNHALAADLLFGVAATGAVTALVLYLRSDSGTEPAPPPPVAVRAGPGSIGLVVGGRF
jgi:hypothetical protein